MAGRPGRRPRPFALAAAALIAAALAGPAVAGPLPAPAPSPASAPQALPAGSVETPGTNELVSTPQEKGGAANASAATGIGDLFAAPTISADGRWVVFLQQVDPAAGNQVMLRDRRAGKTTALDESDSNGPIRHPTISASGRWVAYVRPGDGFTTIVLVDTATGKRSPVPDPPGRNRLPDQPALSGDGRFLAVRAQGTEGTEVLVLDRSAGTWETISVDVNGDPTGGSSAFAAQPAISWDGRYVAFTAAASMAKLVPSPGPINDYRQVFLRDRQSRTTTMISLTPEGAQGGGPSLTPSVSGDGTIVAFASTATDLVAGIGAQQLQVFAWSAATGSVELVSRATDGTAGNQGSGYPAVNGDGSQVAFASGATNLVPGDTTAGVGPLNSFVAVNRYPIGGDIFVRDRPGSRVTRVSVGRDNASEANGFSTYPSISSTGRWVAFTSTATNLVASDTNKATPDVFVRERPPRIAADPDPVDFGSAPLGSLGTTRPATIRSSGVTAARIGVITIGGANASDFIVAANPCTGVSLAPGAACGLQVLFIGTAKGARTATLVIASDAGRPVTLRLVGAVGIPRLKVQPESGPPGLVVIATGSGFPPNAPVALSWSAGITATPLVPVFSDAAGAFTAQVLVLPRDQIGGRTLRAVATVAGLTVEPVTAKFLVTASTGEPPTIGLVQVFAATPGEPIVLRR